MLLTRPSNLINLKQAFKINQYGLILFLKLIMKYKKDKTKELAISSFIINLIHLYHLKN